MLLIETQKIWGKKRIHIKGNLRKKWNAHNDRILKYVKCLWDEMIHIKI